MDSTGYILIAAGVVVVFVAYKFLTKKEEKIVKQVVVEAPVEAKVYYGPIHIFFGSQTGTAANFAKILGQEAEKAGFEPKVCDLIDFDPENFKKVKLALFTMATHGEGEPTDNAKKFYEWMVDQEKGADTLTTFNYSVFGLGNKQYQFYNALGKKTDASLERLGGKRIFKYGEGDDDGSLEEDFNEWKNDLWKELKEKVGPQQQSNGEEAHEHSVNSKLPFIVSFDNSAQENDWRNYKPENDKTEYEFQVKQLLTSFDAKISSIRELRQKTDDGSTIHVEIESGAVGVHYRTADNLAIFPENSSEDVKKFASLLNFDLNNIAVLKANPNYESSLKVKCPFPSPLSVKNYLTYFCDLKGPMRKKQLLDLAEYAPNEASKKRLQYLASSEGKTEYEVQIFSQMRGLLDIVEEYQLKIPFENLILLASTIQPRLFTIASSAKKDSEVVHVCAAKHTDTIGSQERTGFASQFLDNIWSLHQAKKALPKIRINARESTFSLPTAPESPAIMIASGAGIAPFKGFVDEKAYFNQKGEKSVFGELTLFFGCRGKEHDYLYKEEITKYIEDKTINNCFIAFSRDQEKKVYVQNLIEREKDLVIEQFENKNATIYICGSMRMGKDVLKTVGNILTAHRGLKPEDGDKLIKDLEKNKRIIKEIWG